MYVGNSPVNYVDSLGLIRFTSNVSNPVSVQDYSAAYAQMSQLRSSLTQQERTFFQAMYRVDLDTLLMPGGDVVVELERLVGNTQGIEGECKSAVPRINLETVWDPSADRDLFNATLLHELAHYFDANAVLGSFANTAAALATAQAGQDAAAARLAFFHTFDPFLAEYYQYGRFLTYGGQRR